MKTLEEIRDQIMANVPAAAVAGALEIVANPSPSEQHSLLVLPSAMIAVANFLRDSSDLRLDYLSNVTGVDWPDKEIVDKAKRTRIVPKTIEGVETQVEEAFEETQKRIRPGFLEVVYHLFSIEKKHGPVILRMRTVNRTDQVELPSVTPIWRSAELQEREIFDLYGVVFAGHPDLRRLLMWDEFEDHPMRRDYVEPDDFEYEPTPHDEVLKRAAEHMAALHARQPVEEGAGQ